MLVYILTFATSLFEFDQVVETSPIMPRLEELPLIAQSSLQYPGREETIETRLGQMLDR